MAALAEFPLVMAVLESTSVEQVRQCLERMRELAKAARAQEEQERMCFVQLRERIAQLSQVPVGGCGGDSVQGPGDGRSLSDCQHVEVASAELKDFGFVPVESGGL
jgi:hypothetical protein